MNIDFNTAPGFSAYVLLLMFSGIAMVLVASPAVKSVSKSSRALNAVFGVGFVVYGFYLAFLFNGGSYIIFFKAFILPVLLIGRAIRGARAARTQPLSAQADTPASCQQASASPITPAATEGPAAEASATYWAPPPPHREPPAQS